MENNGTEKWEETRTGFPTREVGVGGVSRVSVTGTTHPRPGRRAGRPPGHEPPRPGPSAGGVKF